MGTLSVKGLQTNQMRKEFWAQTWIAVASSSSCQTHGVATSWADKALEEFDKRFSEEIDSEK